MGKTILIKSSKKKFAPTAESINADLTILETIKNKPTARDLKIREEAMKVIMREVRKQHPEAITEEQIENFKYGDKFKIV